MYMAVALPVTIYNDLCSWALFVMHHFAMS